MADLALGLLCELTHTDTHTQTNRYRQTLKLTHTGENHHTDYSLMKPPTHTHTHTHTHTRYRHQNRQKVGSSMNMHPAIHQKSPLSFSSSSSLPPTTSLSLPPLSGVGERRLEHAFQMTPGPGLSSRCLGHHTPEAAFLSTPLPLLFFLSLPPSLPPSASLPAVAATVSPHMWQKAGPWHCVFFRRFLHQPY